MNYKDLILGSKSAEDIDHLFKTTLAAADIKQSNQVVVSNMFCAALEELITDGIIVFLSGNIDFLGFEGGRIPMFRPNTVIQIKK